MLDGKRLEAFLEEGNQLAANAGASALSIAIAGVLAPGLAALPEIGTQGCAPEGEQGANDFAGDWMNAGESSEPGAAEEMRENGLGLVIGGMCGSYAGKMSSFGDAGEPFVAGAPSGVLEIAFRASRKARDVGVRGMKLEAKPGGEPRDELLVCIGRATTQLVIEVESMQNDAQAFAEVIEQAQQCDGIGSPGDRYTNAVAGVEARLCLERSEELIGETRLHGGYRTSRWRIARGMASNRAAVAATSGAAERRSWMCNSKPLASNT